MIHCHRLNHEDNGLMALINVIPEVSTYAVAVPAVDGKPATVQVHDGNGDKVIATVIPFPDFEGTPAVAMADVNGDMMLDLVVGTGQGAAPEVVAYDGADPADGPFKTELTRFAPFDAGFRGGVTVAGADIDGNALADNIIVGSGPGMESQVKVFSSTLPAEPGTAPEVFSSFTPYPGSAVGGDRRDRAGRRRLGPGEHRHGAGPGEAPRVKTFRYDLFTPTARGRRPTAPRPQGHAGKPSEPTMTSEFLAYDEGYRAASRSRRAGWPAPRAARRASSPA